MQYEFGCEPYTVLPRTMAHDYEERFVGYGKDRVSWNYELAAKRAQFWVLPDVFLVHFNTYDEGRKKKYGHFPTDWMLGESCWVRRTRLHTRLQTRLHAGAQKASPRGDAGSTARRPGAERDEGGRV